MRKFLLICMIAALAACQTTPKKLGFSKPQVAALTSEGFKPVEDNYELGLAEKVLFGFDQSDLSSDAAGVLDRLAKVLLGVGISGAGIEGHTDSMGSDEYNQSLSERRAAAVKQQLATSGMAANELRPVGVGETRPIASNDTDEGRSQNRRVVIVVTPLDAN